MLSLGILFLVLSTASAAPTAATDPASTTPAPTSSTLDPVALERLKHTMQTRLGIPPPSPAHRDVIVPQFLRDVANGDAADVSVWNDDDYAYPGTLRSYHPTRLDLPELLLSHRRHLHFTPSALPADETLAAAELKLFSEAVDPSGSGPVIVEVFDVVSRRAGSCADAHSDLTLLAITKVLPEHRGWHSLSVTTAAQRWLADPRTNCGLVVVVTATDAAHAHSASNVRLKLQRHHLTSVEDWLRHYEPLLLLKSRDAGDDVPPSPAHTRGPRSVSRGRRDLDSRREREAMSAKMDQIREAPCSRYLLRIDFAQIGWQDWVLAPSDYQSYMCLGTCPFPLAHHVNSTNHAVIQTIINSFRPHVLGKACCVPTELRSINLLFIDNNQPVLKEYRDMTVTSCGCR